MCPMDKPHSLKDLVELAVQRHQTSIRQLGLKAQSEGFSLSGTTLGAIRSGTYKSIPSVETIKAISWLAGVSDTEAFIASGMSVPGPPFAEELPPGVDHLSPKTRKAVIEMLRVLVELEGKTSVNF